MVVTTNSIINGLTLKKWHISIFYCIILLLGKEIRQFDLTLRSFHGSLVMESVDKIVICFAYC
jgi:hypothetical protein